MTPKALQQMVKECQVGLLGGSERQGQDSLARVSQDTVQSSSRREDATEGKDTEVVEPGLGGTSCTL